MNYLLLFILFLMSVCLLFLLIKLRETSIRKALNLPRFTSPVDDSFVQAKEMGRFLSQRAEACGIYFHHAPDTCGIDRKDFYRISSGEEHAVSELIRLCHVVGCEIVIRQTDTADIETRSNPPDVFAEKIIKMKEQRTM